MLKDILPTYERLSEDNLLKRCMRGATQNANECLNGETWKRCSKTPRCGKKSVQVSATMAVMAFNSGEEELEKIQQKFGLRSSRATLEHAANKTEKCLKRSLKPPETSKLNSGSR